MKVLIVHNSDEVKDCFIGETDEIILEKLKNSEYWEDITNRLIYDQYPDFDDDEKIAEKEIILENVTDLYHDGDSEDGYTLLEAI
jgi:hypothetical protein